MRPRIPLAAVGVVLALALTGCSLLVPSAPVTEESSPATEETTAPPASADPATGDLITGTGYTLNAPEGWTVPPDAPPQADLYLISDVDDADGFTDTINVLLGQTPGQTNDEIEATAAPYLEQVIGAKEVQVRPRVMLGDTEGVHLSSQRTSQSGVTYWTEQIFVGRDDVGYTVTFSFGESFPLEDREAIVNSVLATWTWA